MAKVSIIEITENPIEIISLGAGTSYKKENTSWQRVATCIKNGHMSVTEFAHINFKIEGISRSCLAQLTRHRLMSFCVESQRYVKYNFKDNDWYVMPKKFQKSEAWTRRFKNEMKGAALVYTQAIEDGIRPEDARFLLPEATKTNLTCGMNLREFFNFLQLRLDPHAQWEIRELAEEMYVQVLGHNQEWNTLLSYWRSTCYEK